MSADSTYCQGIDRSSWSPANLIGAWTCGVSNVFDSTVGTVTSEAGETARAATSDASEATVAVSKVAAENSSTIFGSLGLSFGLGLGLSAIAVGGLGFFVYDQTIGSHYLGRIL